MTWGKLELATNLLKLRDYSKEFELTLVNVRLGKMAAWIDFAWDMGR